MAAPSMVSVADTPGSVHVSASFTVCTIVGTLPDRSVESTEHRIEQASRINRDAQRAAHKSSVGISKSPALNAPAMPKECADAVR